MLDIHVTIDGDKVTLAGLSDLSANLPKAIQEGLRRIGSGTFRFAQDNLRGAGGASKKVRNDYVGFEKKSGEKVMFRSYAGAGGYPVPIRTGNLRDLLNYLNPGESKSGSTGSFTAGPLETVIYDSAEYADVIHEGKGSSAKFGLRRYITDAFDQFNQGAHAAQVIDEEIQKEIVHARG